MRQNTTLPQPFDAEAYAADPEAHLNVVEPGRVFQPAQPGPDVERIEYVTGSRTFVQQGERCPFACEPSRSPRNVYVV